MQMSCKRNDKGMHFDVARLDLPYHEIGYWEAYYEVPGSLMMFFGAKLGQDFPGPVHYIKSKSLLVLKVWQQVKLHSEQPEWSSLYQKRQWAAGVVLQFFRIAFRKSVFDWNFDHFSNLNCLLPRSLPMSFAFYLEQRREALLTTAFTWGLAFRQQMTFLLFAARR